MTTDYSGGSDQSTSDDDSEQEWFCGDCGHLYEDETEEPGIWIECSLCIQWFHCSCEGLSRHVFSLVRPRGEKLFPKAPIGVTWEGMGI